MSGHERFDEDVAVYALGALSGEDRRTFEAHLATCATCQETLAELSRVSAGIGLSTEPIEPPADLRARVLARATSQPQAGRVIGATAPAPRAVGGPTGIVRAPEPRDLLRPSWLALAAAIACVIGLGTYAWSLQSQLTSARQLLGAMSARIETLRDQLSAARRDTATLTNTVNVLRSPRMIKVDLKGQGTAPSAAGRAFVSAEQGLIFSAEQLPRLGANRTYQLWVIPKGASPISAGVFDGDAAGSSMLTVPMPRRHADRRVDRGRH